MNLVQSVKEYVLSSKAELEKVSWPSRKTTIRYSVLVISASVIAAAAFAALDFGFHGGVQAVLSRRVSAPIVTEQTNEPIKITPNVEAINPDGTPANNVKITPVPTTPVTK